MSVVINTNAAATLASNNLAASNSMLAKSLNRLSSGSKIVNPSDDAGGLAVSMKLTAAARRQGAVASNIGNAISLLQTQDGALKVSGKILERISELKVLHGDVTKSSSDQANYNSEFQALVSQLVANSAESFNGVAMFGTGTTAGAGNGYIGSVAATEDGATGTAISIAGRDLVSTGSGVGAIGVVGTGTAVSLATLSSTTTGSLSSVSVTSISDAIRNVATMRAVNGAEQSRFGFATELVTVNKANLEAATSRITDVDVATESTQLARWNILVQAGTAMLSQANQSAQSAMRLLQ